MFSQELEFRPLHGLQSVIKVDLPSQGLLATTSAPKRSSAEKEEVVISSCDEAVFAKTQTVIEKLNREKPKEEPPIKPAEVEDTVTIKVESEKPKKGQPVNADAVKPKEVEPEKQKPAEQTNVAKPFQGNSAVGPVKSKSVELPKAVKVTKSATVASKANEISKQVVESERPKALGASKPQMVGVPVEKKSELVKPVQGALNPEVNDVMC